MEFAMNEKVTAAQTRLMELAAKFLDRSEGDLASMRHDLGRVVSDDAAASIGNIRHLAHRMIGTGATLGFDSLSNSARRLETLAETCPAGHMPDELLRAKLASELDALGAELQRLRS
jgi:HPt (histidine-containing phosphotransfer) domain-containing protein